MKCRMLALAALLAVTLSAAAADRVIPLFADESVIVPVGSTLHYRIKTIDNPAVEFTGKVLLTGTYYYGDSEYNDGPDVDLVLIFYPDQASWAKLPRLKIRGQPRDIAISDADAFVRAVIAPDTMARLKKQKNAGYVSGKTAIWVDHFVAGVECDGPAFGAHFVSLAHPATVVAAKSVPLTSC